MSVEPLRYVRNHFSDVIDRVEHEHERVTVTRNGRAVAVILSPEDLAAVDIARCPPLGRFSVGTPESVAAAVIEFLTGALIVNPSRGGKPLSGGSLPYPLRPTSSRS